MKRGLLVTIIVSLLSTTASAQSSHWKLRSKHFIHGMPAPTDGRYDFVPPEETDTVPGVSVLIREGFAVGHCDRFKVPAWVSMRWTLKDFQDSAAQPPFDRPFDEDEELPEYAQAQKSYVFSTSQMQRGHMARHKDNAAWPLGSGICI